MIYYDQITKGFLYLQRVQNSDGGIPATKPGAVSGCWTTAETLETLLSSSYFSKDPKAFAEGLIHFLKSSQLTTGHQRGGWPLVSAGTRASTMATGHAVSALLLVKNFYQEDKALITKVAPLIDKGMEWLTTNQNSDGGWGVEPSGGTDGVKSRMISTVYALRAFLANSKTVDSSKNVRDAVEWIKQLANSDGGFGGQFGDRSDSCNSARAVTALLRSQYCKPSDRLMQRAIRFIVYSRPKFKLWPLDTETYVTEGAPGQTIYNSNTTADVLEAFLRCGLFNAAVEDLVRWFLADQEEEGSWYLGANKDFVREISTWSTNEALSALMLAARVYAARKLPSVQKTARVFKRIAITFALLAVLEVLFIVDLPDAFRNIWLSIPESTRALILGGILIALLVNLLSATIYDYLSKGRLRKDISRGKR